MDRLQDLLQQDPDIKLAILFGSMASGKVTSTSDIDLAIKKSEPLTKLQKQQLIEQVALLTGRSVDLIDLSIVGEPLLGEIIKSGKRLLGSNEDYAAIALEHIYAEADFVPYIKRTLKERRQLWLKS